MKLTCTSSRLALLAAGAISFVPGALAQEARNETDTIVVTGTATPVEYRKMGQSITVITGEMIEDQGYTYVPDVLRQVPSAAVSQQGAPGALTQVRVRGAEANHTLVLLDGIDISSPTQGETDFSTLLTADIERIEILRGPQSGLYGSNALSGVVNLVSRKDIDGTYAGASVEAGSFDTLQIEGNAGAGNSETYAGISVHHISSEGYDVSPDQTANGVPAVGRGGQAGDKEGNQATSVNARAGMKLNDALRVAGVVRYFNSDADQDGQAFGFPIAGRTYDDASRTEQEQLVIGASATIDPYDGAWETVLNISHVGETRRNWLTDFPFLFGPPVPSPDALLQVPLLASETQGTRFKIGGQSTWRFGDEGLRHFITGFAEQEEETYTNPIADRDEERTSRAIGVQYRAEIADQLFLYATGRHDDNDAYQDADTWSLAAAWDIPGTGTRLHGSVGTGVTAPTFIELFGFDPSTFIGNADLVPEEAIGWDAGIEQTLFGGALVMDLTYFASDLENEIYTAFLPTFETTPLNALTESDRDGWELTVNATPLEDLDIYASWTLLDATEPAGIEIRRPKEQGSLDASWRVMGGPVKVNLGVTYTGENVDTDFGSFLRTDLEPYTLVRLGATWQLNDEFELFARGENLLDEEYQEVIGYNAAPQAFYFGVRFRDESRK